MDRPLFSGRWRGAMDAGQAGVVGLTLGAMLACGATAAVMFPRMRALAPTLPEYQGSADAHWVIAAGSVMHRVFVLLGWFVLVGAAVAAATLAASWRHAPRAPRAVCAVAAVGMIACAALQTLWLTPTMTGHLNAFHAAALSGNDSTAVEARAAFDTLHPWANLTLGGAAGAGLVWLLGSAWSAGARRLPDAGDER